MLRVGTKDDASIYLLKSTGWRHKYTEPIRMPGSINASDAISRRTTQRTTARWATALTPAACPRSRDKLTWHARIGLTDLYRHKILADRGTIGNAERLRRRSSSSDPTSIAFLSTYASATKNLAGTSIADSIRSGKHVLDGSLTVVYIILKSTDMSS